jgi:hypothetical protein
VLSQPTDIHGDHSADIIPKHKAHKSGGSPPLQRHPSDYKNNVIINNSAYYSDSIKINQVNSNVIIQQQQNEPNYIPKAVGIAQ